MPPDDHDASGAPPVGADRTAVVTGAAGWLGQNLVRALAASGRRVRALVQSADEAPLVELAGSTVEVIVGDVRDPVAVDRLVEGTSGATVFHGAAVIHPRRAVRDLFDVNVGGTQHVLDRARRSGAARFVHISSNSPFGANPSVEHRFDEDSPANPYLGYGASKLEAEGLVRRAQERGDVETVIVRAPWFYGPFQPERQSRFFSAVRRGRFPLVGDGRQRRSLVYTGHLVQGLLLAESVPGTAGRAYWVADAEPYELRAVIGAVRDALTAEGLPVRARAPRVPVAAAALAARLDALAQARGRYVQPLHVLGELKDTIACDVTRARVELGYAPTTSLVDGMRASVRWALDRGIAL
ncbi:MAG: NAD(P)-dependent oxidoreductase [Actinobacteria bacterium]|nr:NAD(P)-dependent oxidoreductase [Actinomycetota bacterium]